MIRLMPGDQVTASYRTASVDQPWQHPKWRPGMTEVPRWEGVVEGGDLFMERALRGYYSIKWEFGSTYIEAGKDLIKL